MRLRVVTLAWCLLASAVSASTPRPAKVFAENDPRGIYLRGYAVRDTDPETARALFLRVLELTAPGEELHEKAKRRLEQLNERR